MSVITSTAPTATAIDGGVIPYLATIGSIVVLTGESFTLTAAIPSANTDAIAIIGATLSPGGDAVTISDTTYSLGSSGILQVAASDTTATLAQSTYASRISGLTSTGYGAVPTYGTSSGTTVSSSGAGETTSTTEASTTPDETSSAATDAAATTGTDASAGQRQKVMWSVGAMGFFLAVVSAL